MVMKPETLVNIKARVKAECARRKYEGSVADYAGEFYDYVTVPSIGKVIKTEHYEKLAVPLHGINSVDTPEIDGHRITSQSEILNMESKITAYEKQTETSSISDCSESCTGMCVTACSTTCTSYCSQNCSGGCRGGCTNCRGGCWGCEACGNACHTGCASTCSTNCTRACAGGCRGECSSGSS